MSYISIPEYTSLTQAQKERYDHQINQNGRITNMKKTLLHSPPSFDALMTWYPLYNALSEHFEKRTLYFYAYAISSENKCLLCSTFFIKIFKELDITFENFQFSNEEELLINYGRALVNTPHTISDYLYNTLKERYSEEIIVLLTGFAAIMMATNLINTALKVSPDDYLLEHIQS